MTSTGSCFGVAFPSAVAVRRTQFDGTVHS